MKCAWCCSWSPLEILMTPHRSLETTDASIYLHVDTLNCHTILIVPQTPITFFTLRMRTGQHGDRMPQTKVRVKQWRQHRIIRDGLGMSRGRDIIFPMRTTKKSGSMLPALRESWGNWAYRGDKEETYQSSSFQHHPLVLFLLAM